MKHFISVLLLAGLSTLVCLSFVQSASAYPETYADAVVAGQYIDDWHWAIPPMAPDSSTASKVTATAQAHANAFNTGKLGASATASNDTYTWAAARIADTLYLNLPQIIPTADGIVLYLQFHGSMGYTWSTTYQYVSAEVIVTAYETNPPNALANGCLYAAFGGLYAPTTCDGFVENDIRNPVNTQYYPNIGSPGASFSFNSPLYLILKGLSPAAFNGKELAIQILTRVTGGPGYSSFLNTLEFDKDNPIQLYASSTQSLISLPTGSTYHSGSGLGVPQTPVVVGPDITVDPIEIDFHDLLLGGVSDRTITVRNDGNGTLTLGTLGTLPSPFSRVGGDCANGQTLAQESSCSIVVRFAPESTVSFLGTFSITSDDPDEGSVIVTLRGTGIGPEIAVDPIDVDFGRVLLGGVSEQVIVVQNDGNADLTLESIGSPGSPFSVSETTCTPPKTLPPTEKCTITLGFLPTAQGVASSSVGITSNDPDASSLQINLSGKGALLVVEPEEGTIGSNLTISGSGFGGNKGKVLIGGVALKIITWVETEIGGVLSKVPPLDIANDLVVQPKVPKGMQIVEPGMFTARGPEITSVDPGGGNSGSTNPVIISGKFFGNKKGKVTLERFGGVKSCKVLSWTMDGTKGEGVVQFLVPKKISPAPDYTLRVSNSLGSDITPFTVTSP
jgi:hypothetical protein